jgi:membrane protease YdiL (CAAX protease family)
MREKQRISLVWFFVILFVVSWIGAIPMVLASYGQKLSTPVRLLQIFMLFGQGLVAALFVGINDGKIGLRRLFGGLLKWRVGLHWYLMVFFLPAILNLIVRLISASMGLKLPPLAAPEIFLTSFASTFIGYFLLNTEELAWRGVALPKLQERFSQHTASLIIGIIWGVFHVPIFLMKGGHPGGFPFHLYMVMVVAMSFIMTWAFNGTGRSLLIVHLLHQFMNTWGELLPSYPKAVGSVIPGILSTVLLVLWAILVSLPKKNQTRTQVSTVS